MKVCVWDDDADAANEWKTQLDAVLNGCNTRVHAATAEEIEQEIHVLHERRKSYVESDGGEDHGIGSELDDTDILIVDNDLFDLPHLNDLSAETVANRAGLYTDCASIIVLNLNPDLDFDLTLLGHPESKADLHINDKFVADPGLWLQCPRAEGAFRPWHWPLLLSAANLYRSKVDELVKLLETEDRDRPILDYFGFSGDSKRRLSRSARAFLHPRIPAEETSFMDFIHDNAKAVNLLDGKLILGRKDLRKIARIGARRISKWLGRYVLGPQDVLMDLPHLVEKLPFVIPTDKQKCGEFWNSCAKLKGAPVELVEEFGIEQFQMADWFDRPVYWTDEMETEENLEILFETTDANPEELVFCEDSSAFHRADDCDQFVAAYNSISDRRFIRWLKEKDGAIRYGPQSRLAM